jgi:hypothetical protein
MTSYVSAIAIFGHEYRGCRVASMLRSNEMAYLQWGVAMLTVLSLLVGNDFLPHLPSLHIHEGAMDNLLDT